MNRITRERLKKQRAAKGFTGIQIKDLGKFFKRKEMQAPTPSGVTQKKTTTTKPSGTKTTTTKSETKPKGRAAQMMEKSAGNPNRPSEATSQNSTINSQIKKLEEQKSKASPRNKIAIQRKIDKLKAKL